MARFSTFAQTLQADDIAEILALKAGSYFFCRRLACTGAFSD